MLGVSPHVQDQRIALVGTPCCVNARGPRLVNRQRHDTDLVRGNAEIPLDLQSRKGRYGEHPC